MVGMDVVRFTPMLIKLDESLIKMGKSILISEFLGPSYE